MMTRRQALQSMGSGFGMLGLSSLLAREAKAAVPVGAHFPAKAKHVIFLFLNGGPSHVDTFDPKPALREQHGKPFPLKIKKKNVGPLIGSPWEFQRYGESGLPVSDLFPHLAKQIDDICVIRSMWCDHPGHPQALFQMNTGRIIPGFPSMGSWLTYGLGTANENLPGFIVMCPGNPIVGPQLWSSAFLPAEYQGSYVPNFESKPELMIRDLRNGRLKREEQRRYLDLVQAMNKQHLERSGSHSQLEGRIQAMETAYRMQAEALEAFDVSREPQAVRERYGIAGLAGVGRVHELKGWGNDGDFARGCLIARRLVERGVRMVQVYFADDQPWDHHHDIRLHEVRARQADRPMAALLRDLKASGLLQETIVLIGGEFGRTPWTQTNNQNSQNGRDHNPDGFTMLAAGGGFRGGMAYGATDEWGYAVAEKKVHVHDLHATVLHQLGIDHERLPYHYSGREFRLTDIAGNVVRHILT